MKKHRATSSASAASGRVKPQAPTTPGQDTAYLFYTHDHPWRIKNLGETHNKEEFEAVRNYAAVMACNKNSPELEALITKGIEEERPFVATPEQLKKLANDGNTAAQDFLNTASVKLKSTLGIGAPHSVNLRSAAPQHNYQ